MSRRVGYSPAITSEQTFGDWYNERRLLLNPWVAGAVVGAVGVGNSLMFPLWPHTILWVAVASLLLLIWTVTLTHAPQRLFYRIFIAVGAAWMFLLQTHWAAEHWRAFVVGWFIATSLGWIGYWTDQRERYKVRVQAEHDSWPGLASMLGIPKAWMSQKVTTATGWTQRLSWPQGTYTLSQIKGMQERLEGALNVPAGQLRLKPVRDDDDNINPNAIELEANTNSPLRKQPLRFDAPTMRSICDQMYVGNYENHELLNVHWWHPEYGGIHTLAAGATRSGKSGLYRLMLGETAPCDDVVRLGIDAKGGMALRPWAPLFEWLVCGRSGPAVAETIAMLEWLDGVIDYRSTYAAERGWDVWKVSRRHPLIILYIDEAKEVLGLKVDKFHALSLVEKIGTMGAGVGVLLCAATQYPTIEAIGSSQIQANILRRFCFRVERTNHQHVILPDATGIDATFPDKPIGPAGAGWCFFSDMGSMKPIPLRVRDLKPEQVYEIVDSYYHVRCPVDVGTATQPVRREAFEARRRWTMRDLHRPESYGDVDLDEWSDEADEMGARDDDTVTVPTQQNVTENVTQGVTETVTNSVTEGVTNGKEQVVTSTGDPTTVIIDGQEITGVRVPLRDLVHPRNAADAAALRQAQEAFAAQQAEWPTEMADKAFWLTLQTAGDAGVTAATLMAACHRKASWVHERMHSARMSKRVVEVEGKKSYYKLAPGMPIPELANAV
jgi:hypothetical protein